MLKKQITYTDPFTDKPVTEEHYFHLSKADLLEMEMVEHKLTYTGKDGQEYTGMQAKLQKIVDSEDGKAILAEFKDILRRSYGVKDGDRFVRSPEVWARFEGSEAYSQLLFEIFTDGEEAARFTNAVIPSNLEAIAKDIADRADAEEKREAATVTPITPAPAPAPSDIRDEVKNATSENPVTLTKADMVALDADVFKSGLADGRFKLS